MQHELACCITFQNVRQMKQKETYETSNGAKCFIFSVRVAGRAGRRLNDSSDKAVGGQLKSA